MRYYKDDFLHLKQMIEKEQSITVKFSKFEETENGVNVSLTSEERGAKDRFFQVELRFRGDTLRVAWLFLIHTHKGTGTKILKWLIDYCKCKGIANFEVWCVENTNIAMKNLCHKLGLHVCRNEDERLDYSIHLSI
jgi:GNAT superfamily N-acetyltransferase